MTLLSLALSISAALAAFAVSARCRDSTSSERAVVAAGVWLSLVAPVGVHATSFGSRASLASLAIANAIALLIVVLSASLGIRIREFFRALLAALREFSTLPFRALAVTLRARSLAFLGALLVVLGVCAVLLGDANPSVVGLIGLGPAPRADVAASGGALGTLIRAVSFSATAAAGYLLARRQGADRAGAVGWGSVIALAPCALRLIRADGFETASTALLLIASALSIRGTLSWRDAVLGLVALTAAGSLQAWAVLKVLPAALTILVLVVIRRRAWGTVRASSTVVAAAFALGGAFFAARQAKNASLHVGSPITDWVTLWDVPLRNEPLTNGGGFGVGFSWVLLPAALIAVAIALVDLISAIRAKWRRGFLDRPPLPKNPVLVALMLVLSTPFGIPPAVALVAASVVLSSWLVTRISAPRIGEGLIGLNMLAALTFHYWYGY